MRRETDTKQRDPGRSTMMDHLVRHIQRQFPLPRGEQPHGGRRAELGLPTS